MCRRARGAERLEQNGGRWVEIGTVENVGWGVRRGQVMWNFESHCKEFRIYSL